MTCGLCIRGHVCGGCDLAVADSSWLETLYAAMRLRKHLKVESFKHVAPNVTHASPYIVTDRSHTWAQPWPCAYDKHCNELAIRKVNINSMKQPM